MEPRRAERAGRARQTPTAEKERETEEDSGEWARLSQLLSGAAPFTLPAPIDLLSETRVREAGPAQELGGATEPASWDVSEAAARSTEPLQQPPVGGGTNKEALS